MVSFPDARVWLCGCGGRTLIFCTAGIFMLLAEEQHDARAAGSAGSGGQPAGPAPSPTPSPPPVLFHNALYYMAIEVLGRPRVPNTSVASSLVCTAIVLMAIVVIPVRVAAVVREWPVPPLP